MRWPTLFVVALLALSVPPAPVPAAEPAKPPRMTGHDEFKVTLEFNRRTLAGAYQRAGKRDPKWDRQAERFLEAMAKHFTYAGRHEFYWPEPQQPHTHRLELGKAAIDAGCDDPLVLYCYVVPLEVDDPKEALPLLRRAYEGLAAGDYPPHRVYAAANRLATRSTDAAERKAAREAAVTWRLRAVTGPLDDATRRAMYWQIWADVGRESRAEQQSFVDALDASPDADPWFRDVAAGVLHTWLAWDSRGSGFANSVTERGWRGFAEHLREARDRLTRAWKAAPSLPQAPSAMIPVAMGGGELGEDPMDWFARALDAQVDFLPAYDAIYRALLPRWGGSHEQMMEVADACVEVGRYETLVPWQYITGLNAIRKDGAEPLRRPAAYRKAVEVAEGYAKALEGKKRGDWYKTYSAALGWRAQRLDDARKVLEGLGGRADPGAFYAAGANDGLEAMSQVYAFTGPHADEIKEANETAYRDEDDVASAMFERIAGELPDNDPSLLYIRNRARWTGAAAKLQTGEWVDVQPVRTLGGWRRYGNWSADEKGVVTGSGSDGDRMLLFTLITLGSSYEVTGRLEFAGTPSEPAGIAIADERDNRRGWILLDRARGGVSFSFSGRPRLEPVEIKAVNDFQLRCEAGELTMEVNGEPVPGRFKLPADLASRPMKIGIGGPGEGRLRVSNLKARKLVAAADGAKPTEDPPAGEDR